MIAESMSLSPYVVAMTMADNEIRQHIATKVINDQLDAEAKLAAKIVTAPSATSKNQPTTEHSDHKIDIRM